MMEIGTASEYKGKDINKIEVNLEENLLDEHEEDGPTNTFDGEEESIITEEDRNLPGTSQGIQKYNIITEKKSQTNKSGKNK